MKVPEELINFLKSEDDFLILTHVSPDADGIGSSVALSFLLDSLGKRSSLADKETVPLYCEFLPGKERFTTLQNIAASRGSVNAFGAVILVDCNSYRRVFTRDNIGWIEGFRGRAAVIDHHETDNPDGQIRWIVPEAPATGVMIYHLLNEFSVPITPPIATNLYAAIALDTGNFRYENTSPEVFAIASDLTRRGAQPHIIYRHLYELWPEGRFRLFVKVLQTLDINGRIGFIAITKEMFEETGTTAEDTESFVSFPRMMRDIQISVLLREIDERHFKVSLRSKGGFNVARVAEAFGGGGHANAAGCTVKADIVTAKALLHAKIEEMGGHQ